MPNIVKNTTLFNPLELIAPYSCRGCGRIGSPLCDCCKNNIFIESQNFCPHCKTIITEHSCPKCPELPPTYIIGSRHSIIGELVQSLKYSSSRALAKPLAEIIEQILPEIVGEVIIVPLPTISRHIRERGLDHTYLIAKQLCHLRPNWRVQKALVRAKDTVQVGASEFDRHRQAKKAYTLNPKIKLNPSATYILLDDVWTTGASMLSAHKIIANKAPKTLIVALTVS